MSPSYRASGKRPPMPGKEVLFFVITFAVAIVFQFAVILKVAGLVDW
jgi:hypothetical protein